MCRPKCYAFQSTPMPTELCNLSSTVDAAVDSASSTTTATFKDTVRCKGVQRAVAQRIPFAEYQRTLETGLPRHDVTYGIRSRQHKLHIERLFKLSLKLADDKRYFDDLRIAPIFSHQSLVAVIIETSLISF